MTQADLTTFEGFAEFAAGAVTFDWEQSGDDPDHGMTPFMLTQRVAGAVPDVVLIEGGLMSTPAGRALLSAGVADILGAVQAVRCAVAVQAQMVDEQGAFAGVILAVYERDRSAFFYSRLTDPPSRRVQGWEPSGDLGELLSAGIRSALGG